jgi:hypothetical protein
MATAREVAQWMAAELEMKKYLEQETVVWQIRQQFGGEFVYVNENGNDAIGGDVLKEFRQITDGKVVWDRSERAWRPIGPNETYKARQVD